MQNTASDIIDMRHRMANDLAMLVSALEIQRRSAVCSAGEAIDDTIGGLLALSLFYRKLYDLGPDVGFISLSEHVAAIAAAMRVAYLDRLNITLTHELDDVAVPSPVARDFGRIVAELIANAAKHAFRNIGGRITLDLIDDEDALLCAVADDGCGFSGPNLCNRRGGLLIASELALKLGGCLGLETGVAKGARFVLRIPRASSA